MSARESGRERADRTLQRLRAAGKRRCRGAAVRSIGPHARSAHCGPVASGAVHIPVAAIRLRHRSGYWNRCRCRIGRRLRDSLAPSKMPSPSDASVSGQRPATAPEAASAGFPARWCGWHGSGTSAHRPRHGRCSHSTGRRPSAAMHSSTSWVCSAAWIWIGPSGTCLAHDPQCLGRDRAQRMRRDADARFRQTAPRSPACARTAEKPIRIVEKAPLAGGRCARRRNRHRHRTTATASGRCRVSALAAAMRAAISPMSA